MRDEIQAFLAVVEGLPKTSIGKHGLAALGISGEFVPEDLVAIEGHLLRSYRTKKTPFRTEDLMTYGAYLGHMLVKQLNGRWDFSQVGNGSFDDEILNVAVILDSPNHGPVHTFPFKRLLKFVLSENRKRDGLFPWFHGVQAVTSGSVPVNPGKPGEWIDVPGGYGRIRIRNVGGK